MQLIIPGVNMLDESAESEVELLSVNVFRVPHINNLQMHSHIKEGLSTIHVQHKPFHFLDIDCVPHILFCIFKN